MTLLTITQIHYFIKLVELKSFTAAAKALYTAPSNLSNMVRSLEQELGFMLFNRTSDGAVLTSDGRRFYHEALKVEIACENISLLKAPVTKQHLVVDCIPLSFCDAAIVSFLTSQPLDQNGQMIYRFRETSSQLALRNLMRHESDIAVIDLTLQALLSLQTEFKDLFETVWLMNLERSITIRKGHPVLSHFTPGETFDIHLLDAYPEVVFVPPKMFSTNLPKPLPTDACRRDKIFVYSSLLKNKIVSETDAFSVSCRVTKQHADQYGCTQIRFKDDLISLYGIYSKETQLSDLAKDFLEKLKCVCSED